MSRRAPSLPRLLAELIAEADARGASTEKRLEHGAILKARSKVVTLPHGSRRRRQLLIGRHGAPVGVGEVAIFMRDARIPLDAEGVCYFPTPGGVYFVALTWDEVAISLPFEALPESL